MWLARRRFSPLSQVDVGEGDGSSASHDVPVLGAVKIVPPVGGSILTAPARRQCWLVAEEPAGHEDMEVRWRLGS